MWSSPKQAVADAKLVQLISTRMPWKATGSAPDMLGPVTMWKLEQSSMYVSLACGRSVECIRDACVKAACMADVGSNNPAEST
jgi:hypothetical protein